MVATADDLPLVADSATIAFVDLAESVRQVMADEWTAVRRIRALLAQAASQVVPAHGGRVVEQQGDGLLLRFDEPLQALECATALHALAAGTAGAAPEGEPLRLRVGLHRGPLWTDQVAVYGITVNLAARIAQACLPGETWLSETARQGLVDGLDGVLEDLGERYLKHVDEPMRLFRAGGPAAPLPRSLRQAISARLRVRPTLAVLPVVPLGSGPAPLSGSGRPAVAWTDIVTDQLCQRFSRSAMLHVISGWSSQMLRGRQTTPGAVHRDWHADFVLEASLAGPVAMDAPMGELRLHARLWRRRVARPILEFEVRGRAADLLAADSDLISELVQRVARRVLDVEIRQANSAAPLPNLSSHALYLGAVDLLHRVSARHFDRARDMLLTLHERAPRASEPLAWLARWHVFRVMQGWSDDAQRDSRLAMTYSERALERDPESALALTMAGAVHAGVRRDPATALHFYDQALSHNPNESLAWLMRGVSHGFVEAAGAALADSEIALGLAPLEPIRHFYDSLAATASLRAGELRRCVALARRAILASRTHGSSYRALAIAQSLLGDGDGARQSVQELLAIEPECTVSLYLGRVGPVTEQSRRFAQALRDAGLPQD